MPPIALTIAGSDPSGGAGLQADLKTFHQFGVYGEAVISLITVQNSQGVRRVEVLRPELVLDQLAAVIEDMPPSAAKTGALGSAEVVEALASIAAGFTFPLVIDPVIAASRGIPLARQDVLHALRDKLMPHAALITPNIPEAEALAGIAIESPATMREAARIILGMGARAVVVKGGHSQGDAIDLLFDGSDFREFTAPRLPARNTHGTGCTFSAAITACLARGLDLAESVRRAKQFIHEAIRTAPDLGRGSGPVNHHAALSLGGILSGEIA